MVKDTKIYLACPYSSPDEHIRKYRVDMASRCAASVIMAGYKLVCSPLSHTANIAKYLPDDTLCNWKFWKKISLEFVDWSDVVIQLMIQGWQFSVGCEGERNRAYLTYKPVIHMFPNEILSGFDVNFNKYLQGYAPNRSALESCNSD